MPKNWLKIHTGLMVVAMMAVLFVLGMLFGQYLWKPQIIEIGKAFSPSPPYIGELAPDFELTSLSGETIRLSALRGQPVVVNFWATWCGPCAAEMPAIQSRYTRHAGNLHVLAVNAGESAEAVRDFVQKNGLTFDVLLDPQSQVTDSYFVNGFPTTFFLDAEGYIRDMVVGGMSESELDQHLKGIGLTP